MIVKPYSVIDEETFFELLAGKISPSLIDLIRLAYKLAKYAHAVQTRKSNGERYFEHPRRVARILIEEWNIYDHEMIITALLHDVVEDAWMLATNDIRTIFGDNVANMVDLLTKPAVDEGYRSKVKYAEKLLFAGCERTLVVKTADIISNLRELVLCDEEKIIRNIEIYKELFREIAMRCGKLVAFDQSLDYAVRNGPEYVYPYDIFVNLSGVEPKINLSSLEDEDVIGYYIDDEDDIIAYKWYLEHLAKGEYQDNPPPLKKRYVAEKMALRVIMNGGTPVQEYLVGHAKPGDLLNEECGLWLDEDLWCNTVCLIDPGSRYYYPIGWIRNRMRLAGIPKPNPFTEEQLENARLRHKENLEFADRLEKELEDFLLTHSGS